MRWFCKYMMVLFYLIILQSAVFSQSLYDIQLTLDTVDCMNNTACYNVQVRSADGINWGLAGQNYRLYYDGALASWQSGSSTLGGSYQNFSVIQNLQNVDASATGSVLAFEENLSFLNYTMDLSNPSIGGIDLPTDGSWVTTSNLCFALQDALLNDPATCLEIVWARDGHTNAYATSFVEVSEWVEADSTQMANGNIYDGLESSDGDAACFTEACKSVGDYDIQLTLDTVDCMNNSACYNVQLRSADGESWGLAGQNYRLYYDGALASWQSGSSILGGSYQSFSLIQDIQNVDAAATGSNLAFEDDLSFLNYTMDLSNPSTGGIDLPADGSWVTTSNLCFALQDTLLNDPATCLEIVWARDGHTNAYATSFVEVSEWVEADSTQMANGNIYDGLESSDGDAACFTDACKIVGDYGIRLTFDTLDCIAKTACFNVQLRTEDGNGWGLAGQNYRIYYDASLAAWQSGTSKLGASYQGFQLIQDIQDVNASATNSNLFFENTLGFLNYTMDLNDPSAGGSNLPADGSWLTTSQLCFTLEDALLDNPSTCLEAIWARDTLTAKYATSFVEVSEWIEPNSTQMANGVYYDDLDASDGNDACFVNSCLYDYGDLQDVSNATNTGDYQTQLINNGPAHLIIAGLSLGSIVDDELDGQSSMDALGDGVDEDGLIIFSTLNVSPGTTIKLPFSYTNLTGHTAHLEAWLDWNGDGDFDPINELVADWDEVLTAFPDVMTISIPSTVQTDAQLGLRIRLSLQDDMTPYGIIGSGEIEDYLIGISCKQVCLPFTTELKK